MDPKTAPVSFTLKPHDLDRRDRALIFKGRVLNEDDKPVPGAIVEPLGFTKGQTGQFGGLKGFDELSVTNEKGEFRLGVPEPGLALCIQVSARFMAPRKFGKLPVGDPHDLRLVTGVTVTGRVMKGGQVIPGVAIGLAQKDRGAETFVGEFQAATDDQGVFRILNVPPEDLFVVYGQMASLRPYGAVAVKEIRTGANRSELALGDLDVRPGHRLVGRVVLADAKQLPAGTRVLVSREEAWDYQIAEVDAHGVFRLEGLPSERYRLSVNVPGYYASPKNASYDLLNGMGLLGTVRADIEGLRLLLEPGKRPARPGGLDRKLYEEYTRRRDNPLRGAPKEDGRK